MSARRGMPIGADYIIMTDATTPPSFWCGPGWIPQLCSDVRSYRTWQAANKAIERMRRRRPSALRDGAKYCQVQDL